MIKHNRSTITRRPDSSFGPPLTLWPGITFCVGIAGLSFTSWLLLRYFYSLSISTLMWAFIYSILIANLVPLPETLQYGINFCSRTLLRGVIASMGIVTSVLIWSDLGVGILSALLVIFSTFFLSRWLGDRVKVSSRLSLLIGVGTSICGASAIAAIAPAIDAKEEEIGTALACITLFGVLAMFLYPFLFTNTFIGDLLGHDLNLFAIWVGTGVHETAGVTACGSALGVCYEALTVKSIRIFMIGPITLLATYLYAKKQHATTRTAPQFSLPRYAIAFIFLAFFGTLLDTFAEQILVLGVDWLLVKAVLKDTIFKFLLALCFAGVGVKVRFKHLSRLGTKAFGLGAVMSVFAGGLALLLVIFLAGWV